jgi:hypothetical protein
VRFLKSLGADRSVRCGRKNQRVLLCYCVIVFVILFFVFYFLTVSIEPHRIFRYCSQSFSLNSICKFVKHIDCKA